MQLLLDHPSASPDQCKRWQECRPDLTKARENIWESRNCSFISGKKKPEFIRTGSPRSDAGKEGQSPPIS